MAVSSVGNDPQIVVCGRDEQRGKQLILHGPNFSKRRDVRIDLRRVSNVDISPNGSRIVFAGPEGAVVVGQKVADYWPWLRGSVRAFFLSDSRVVLKADKETLYLWDYEKEGSLRQLKVERDCHQVLPSGRSDRLFANIAHYLEKGRTVLKWVSVSTENGRSLQRLYDVKGWLLLPTKRDLLVGVGADGTTLGRGQAVRKYTPDAGKRIDPDVFSESRVFSIDVAPDGTIGAGFEDGEFWLFHPPDYAPIRCKSSEAKQPIGRVHATNDNNTWVIGHSVDLRPNGEVHYLASLDATTSTWRRVASNEHVLDIFPGADRSDLLLKVNPGAGAGAANQTRQHAARRLVLATGAVHDIPSPLKEVDGPMAWTPEKGGVFAVAEQADTFHGWLRSDEIQFFDNRGERLGATPTIDGELVAMAWRGADSLVVCQGVGKMPVLPDRRSESLVDTLVTLRRFPSGEVLGSLRLDGRPRWATFAEDGRWLLVGLDDRVDVIDLTASPKTTARLKMDYGPTCGAWITPGNRVAIGGDDSRVRIYKVGALK